MKIMTKVGTSSDTISRSDSYAAKRMFFRGEIFRDPGTTPGQDRDQIDVDLRPCVPTMTPALTVTLAIRN